MEHPPAVPPQILSTTPLTAFLKRRPAADAPAPATTGNHSSGGGGDKSPAQGKKGAAGGKADEKTEEGKKTADKTAS